MPNVLTPSEKFQHRCEARAILWQQGFFGDDAGAFHQAVDPLVAIAKDLGLDTDAAQRIIGIAFAPVRDDLYAWRP